MRKTLENLAKAFAGESMARNRYTSFAKIAKKEGYEQIADALLTTADNEREHASWNLKLINALTAGASSADEIRVEALVETQLGDTVSNLKAAVAAEHHETTRMYPHFAEVADNEGLPEIAKRLRAIGVAEAHHEENNKKMLAQLEAGTFFKKERNVEWACRKCGYVHVDDEPPQRCPACDHDRAYFELKCEPY